MKPRAQSLTLKPRVETLSASSLLRFQSRYPRPECVRQLGRAGSFRSSITPRIAQRTRAISGVHRGESAADGLKISPASVVVARGHVGYSDDDYAGTLGAFWALRVAKAIIAETSWGLGRATVTKRRRMIASSGQPTEISEAFFRIEILDTNDVFHRRIAGKSGARAATKKTFLERRKNRGETDHRRS